MSHWDEVVRENSHKILHYGPAELIGGFGIPIDIPCA